MLSEDATERLEGGDLLPGFSVTVSNLFSGSHTL